MNSNIRYSNQNITEIKKTEVPTEVPIIPLRNAVVFPGILLPIFVGRTESVNLVEKFNKPGTLIGLFTQKSPGDEQVNDRGLYHTGTLAEVHRVMPMGEGGYQVFLQGIQKIELIKLVQNEPYLTGRIMPLGELQDISEEEFRDFQGNVIKYVESHPGIPDEIANFVKRLSNPGSLVNQVIFFSQKEIEKKIDFLRISSVAEKIKLVKDYLKEETNRIKMENEVHDKVEKDAARMQREFYLRKQMETIRKELGESEEDETDELEKQLAEKWLPEAVRKTANKEMKRLKRAQEGPQGGGLEAGQIRNWLELLVELPWEDPEPRNINVGNAAQILEEDHEGLEEVKKRIVEFLAVEKQTGGSRAPILCLVGPPGVGKTSLAKSVARAMNRPLVRAALGGVRDEAEIRGHRRTYVGALPGKILTAMKKAETRDPVFLLDEIDKTGNSYQGDPAAALLEVLDPEQNHSFEDHYLGQPYDLSRVLFIATANTLDTIPAPLLDRMELVQLSGYTLAEKTAIAENHLIPRILGELKFKEDQLTLTHEAIKKVITAHTRESGVRNLKRKLESVARKAIRTLIEEQEKVSEGAPEEETDTVRAEAEPVVSAENEAAVEFEMNLDEGQNEVGELITDGVVPQEPVAVKGASSSDVDSDSENEDEAIYHKIVYDVDAIKDLLGRDRFHQDVNENTGIPGVAVGLAWTPVGGDILFIEATAYKGKGDLKLSGQLGDVMKESAHAAFSFIRTHAIELGIDPDVFTRKDIHVHIPSGAIPKDGPSAGVTLITALASVLSGRPVVHDLAMTGEISLRGKILPVGGIKEKVLAARAAGIKTVFLPEKNRPDYEEIPAHVTEGLAVEYFSDMKEILKRTVPRRVKESAPRGGDDATMESRPEERKLTGGFTPPQVSDGSSPVGDRRDGW